MTNISIIHFTGGLFEGMASQVADSASCGNRAIHVRGQVRQYEAAWQGKAVADWQVEWSVEMRG